MSRLWRATAICLVLLSVAPITTSDPLPEPCVEGAPCAVVGERCGELVCSLTESGVIWWEVGR